MTVFAEKQLLTFAVLNLFEPKARDKRFVLM